MTIYTAAAFEAQDRISIEAGKLEDQGHVVLSSWLNEEPQEVTGARRKGWALRDLADIDDVNLLILDTIDPSVRGGREFEAGYAFGKGIRVIRVGPARSVFHELLPAYESWAEIELG